ncbi:hypothetical protein PMI22_00560 [Pseudomonas sp. GM21]|nr:hypothetical protein PMI22_00560 [Pseudomonas sp. GM21]MDR6926933.1 hypothetical protein [Pseudomonas sp. BE134]
MMLSTTQFRSSWQSLLLQSTLVRFYFRANLYLTHSS